MSNLKILREINNYTQEYVAEQIGVDQSTYSKIERNPKNLKVDQAEKLAQLYEVELEDILLQGVTLSFTHNTFTDKGYGYVHNIFDAPQNSKSEKDDLINNLKEQIEYLKAQNAQLLALLGEKR